MKASFPSYLQLMATHKNDRYFCDCTALTFLTEWNSVVISGRNFAQLLQWISYFYLLIFLFNEAYHLISSVTNYSLLSVSFPINSWLYFMFSSRIPSSPNAASGRSLANPVVVVTGHILSQISLFAMQYSSKKLSFNPVGYTLISMHRSISLLLGKRVLRLDFPLNF